MAILVEDIVTTCLLAASLGMLARMKMEGVASCRQAVGTSARTGTSPANPPCSSITCNTDLLTNAGIQLGDAILVNTSNGMKALPASELLSFVQCVQDDLQERADTAKTSIETNLQTNYVTVATAGMYASMNDLKQAEDNSKYKFLTVEDANANYATKDWVSSQNFATQQDLTGNTFTDTTFHIEALQDSRRFMREEDGTVKAVSTGDTSNYRESRARFKFVPVQTTTPQ